MEQLGGGVWGGAVAPLASVYVAFLFMLFLYGRSGGRDRGRRLGNRGRPSWAALVRHLAATAAGGYLVFLAVILVFSFMFAEEQQAIGDALIGGSSVAVLAFLALALLGWLERLIRDHRSSNRVKYVTSGKP